MLNFLAALGLGILSFVSPCILPLVPVYLANIAGASVLTPELPGRRHIFLHTISFIVGFSLVYAALGVLFGLLGAAAPREVLGKVAGALLVTFGIFLIAATKIPWLNYEKRLDFTKAKGTGYLRSLLIGVIFSLGLTPCTSPHSGGCIDHGCKLANSVAGSLSLTWLLFRAGAAFHRREPGMGVSISIH